MTKHTRERGGFQALPQDDVKPDRDQIARWWRNILKTVPPAEGLEVSIRLFRSDDNRPDVYPVPYETPEDFDKIVDETLRWADWAVEQKEQKGEIWVVSPCVQVFWGPNSPHRAKKDDGTDLTPGGRANLAYAGTVFIEADARPVDAAEAVQAVLCKPSMAVSSGGVWQAPSGATQDKMHVYWAIDPPVHGKDQIDRLWAAAEKLKVLADAGDASAQPVHPMRAAGTVHTKQRTHRLARVLDTNDTTITLEDLEAAVAGVVVPTKGQGTGTGSPNSGGAPRLDLAKTVEDLLSGGDFHSNVTALSGSLMQRTLGPAEVEGLLEVLVKASPRAAAEPGRLQALLGGEIKNAVRSAEWKFTQDTAKEVLGGGKLWSPHDTGSPGVFPLDVLPKRLQVYVREVADAYGVEEGPVALMLLAVASGAIDARFRLNLREKAPFWVRAILWAVMIGEPSARKSPPMEEVAKPLTSINALAVAQREADLKQWHAAKAQRRGNQPSPPKPHWVTRYTTSTPTSEALGSILSQQDRGVMIFNDEISGMLMGMGRYNTGGGDAERAFFLEAYNGGSASADRKDETNSTHVKVNAVPMLGGIQPSKFKKRGAGDIDGLWERNAPCHMGDAVQSKDVSVDASAKDWEAIVQTLTRLQPVDLRADKGAVALNRETEADLIVLAKSAGVGLKGAMLKAHGLAGRIALVLHLLDYANAALDRQGVPDEAAREFEDLFGEPMPPMALTPPSVVPEATMQRALRVYWEFILPEQAVFWNETVSGPAKGFLRDVADFILRKGAKTLTPRDFKKGLKTWFPVETDPWSVAKALEPMVTNGWLVPMETKRAGEHKWAVADAVWETQEIRRGEAIAARKKSAEVWTKRGLRPGAVKKGGE